MVRKKNRYLVMQIQYADNKIDATLHQGDIFSALYSIIQELYGDYGIGMYSMNIYIKYTNPYTGIFFLQCPRDYHQEIRTCLTFIKMLKNKLCVLTCIRLTATIKSAEKFLLEYNTKHMNLLYQRCKTPKERNEILNYMKELNLENVIDSTVSFDM